MGVCRGRAGGGGWVWVVKEKLLVFNDNSFSMEAYKTNSLPTFVLYRSPDLIRYV